MTPSKLNLEKTKKFTMSNFSINFVQEKMSHFVSHFYNLREQSGDEIL